MINALQHVGQGVRNVDTTYAFYRRNFGYKLKLNDLTVASKELQSILGSVETMRMMMAANVKGGGIIELIEHKSKPITSLPEGNIYSHRGILEVGYGVLNIEKVVSDFQSRGIRMLTPIEEIDLGKGRRWRCAYLMATVGVMKEKGVDLYLPPMEMSMGTGSKGFLAYIRDPDGTTVEFVEVKSVF